ncbi:MAG TPA: amidase [Conexibacter sp.]|nr:amidase [Conexibacter sp.]
MTTDAYDALDALAQAELVRSGAVSALELVDAAIARIERDGPELNCIATPLFEAARRRAVGPLPDAPLAGVPFLIKDLGMAQAGVRQTDGSRALREHVAERDDALVVRYERAGLIVLARTTVPEFGNQSTTEPQLFGPCRNPWDRSRSAGGSSGGSAAAVAARFVPAAHASDGGGSIRIPASCCGLFGLKPTRALTSTEQDDSVLGFVSEHAVARSVRDSAALLDVATGGAPAEVGGYLAESLAEPPRLRIGWSDASPFGGPVDAECRAAVAATARLLEELGHEVVEATPRLDPEIFLEPMLTLWAVGNASAVARLERRRGAELPREALEQTTWELVEHGRGISAVQLSLATDEVLRLRREVAPFFAGHDAWITPTLARPPERLGVLNASHGSARAWWVADLDYTPWTLIANATGTPAMSVPLHWTADGLPVGVHVIGRCGADATLLRLAHQLERARPWAQRRPPMPASAR